MSVELSELTTPGVLCVLQMMPVSKWAFRTPESRLPTSRHRHARVLMPHFQTVPPLAHAVEAYYRPIIAFAGRSYRINRDEAHRDIPITS